MKELRSQIIILDRKYGLTDPQYIETRNEVITIINTIEETKDKLSSAIKTIYIYQRRIITAIEEVKKIRQTLDDTKTYISQFSEFMYKVSNEFYTDEGVLDEIKLFIKTENNINEQLSNTAMVESIMHQMHLLVETLTAQEKATIQSIKDSNNNRREIREIIGNYQQQLQNLQEQRKFLSDYLTLYESHKVKMSNELSSLFSTRSEVYTDIYRTIDMIKSNQHTQHRDVQAKLTELTNTKPFAKRDENAAPLSWPLYPVVLISRYFGDQAFEQKYRLPFEGIEIPAAQHTPLYAVDEGLVYKIANKDGI